MSVLAYHVLAGTLYVSAGISCSSRHTVCQGWHIMHLVGISCCMSVLAYHALVGTLYVSAGISCSSRHTVCQCWHIML